MAALAVSASKQVSIWMRSTPPCCRADICSVYTSTMSSKEYLRKVRSDASEGSVRDWPVGPTLPATYTGRDAPSAAARAMRAAAYAISAACAAFPYSC